MTPIPRSGDDADDEAVRKIVVMTNTPIAAPRQHHQRGKSTLNLPRPSKNPAQHANINADVIEAHGFAIIRVQKIDFPTFPDGDNPPQRMHSGLLKTRRLA